MNRDFDAVRISLASPEQIREWSDGEVTRPETVHLHDLSPIPGGLFCERIFGFDGKRMGHIELAAPVVHPWFYRSMPSRIAQLFGMGPISLRRVIHGLENVVTDPGDTTFHPRQRLTDDELTAARAVYGNRFAADTGAVAVEQMLARLDFATELARVTAEMRDGEPNRSRIRTLESRRRLLETLRDSPNRPEWMVLRCVAVIPAALRPLIRRDNGDVCTANVNDLYRRLINRNNRLRRLVELNAPEVILRNERRHLQRDVEALFDNSRLSRPVLRPNRRPLQSLADRLRGVRGRFQAGVGGKRVDFSAVSVVVPDPLLKLHQCGLPRLIARTLFRPFVLAKLRQWNEPASESAVADALEAVVKGHPVILSRPPVLKRSAIQAFEPVLVDGNAVRVHPLLSESFHTEFAGGRIRVHLPLSVEAQAEARVLMMPPATLFDSASWEEAFPLRRDVVLGASWLTRDPEPTAELRTFWGEEEVRAAREAGKVGVHTPIRVRMLGRRVETTVGRVLFHAELMPDTPFRNVEMTGKSLNVLVRATFQRSGRNETLRLIDRVQILCLRELTRAGISLAIGDIRVPANREQVFAEKDVYLAKVQRLHERGGITNQERYNRVIDQWTQARDEIARAMMEEYRDGGHNPLFHMARCGAVGGIDSLRKLGGMIGLTAWASGEIREWPIRGNLRHGLTMCEAFLRAIDGRRLLLDETLKPADPDSLTRKLLQAVDDVVITLADCGTSDGVWKEVNYRHADSWQRPVTEAVRGRARLADDVRNGEPRVRVRSPVTCRAPVGVCQRCYGTDLATGSPVEVGTAVGVTAAMALGEPGTRLTKRMAYHGGDPDGVILGRRILQLFDNWPARRPAVLATCAGVVERDYDRSVITVRQPDGTPVEHRWPNDYFWEFVERGEPVEPGDVLAGGLARPSAVFALGGVAAVHRYVVAEMQTAFRQQRVHVDDRHIEVVLSRMLPRGPDGRVAELVPISRLAARTPSFLAAASFRDATRVLIDAALAGQVDPLVGIRENLLVGRRIPAGTGFRSG